MPALVRVTADEAGTTPSVTVTVPPLPAEVVQVSLEYTVYVTVPEALAAVVPDRVAVSVTPVLVGTEIESPVRPPPASEVATVTEAVSEVTVSTSAPQVLVEAALVESPE